MRLRAVVAVVVLLLACRPLFAQSNRVSVYLTNPGYAESDYSGSHFTGGVGFSLTRFWTPRVSTELVVGAERSWSGYVAFDSNGNVIDRRDFRYTAYPVDLLAQYHVPLGDSRWKPYLGAGVRYLDPPRGEVAQKFTPELDAGVTFNMTRRLGLVFDVRFSEGRSETWDPKIKPSAGLSWRF